MAAKLLVKRFGIKDVSENRVGFGVNKIHFSIY